MKSNYIASQLNNEYVAIHESATPFTFKIFEVNVTETHVDIGGALSWKTSLTDPGQELDWEDGPDARQSLDWEYASLSGKCRFPLSAFSAERIEQLKAVSATYADLKRRSEPKNAKVIPWIVPGPGTKGLRFKLKPGKKVAYRLSSIQLQDPELIWSGGGMGAPAEPWEAFEATLEAPVWSKPAVVSPSADDAATKRGVVA